MGVATLVVHPGTLGDVLISLGLGKRLPAPVWLAVRGSVLELRARVPWVERWIDLDGTIGPALLGESSTEWPADLCNLRRLIVLRADPSGAVATRLRHRSDAPVLVASARPPASCSAHAHVANLLGVSSEPATLPWVAAARSRPGTASVVIHPGSGARAKRWPLSAFGSVASQLRTKGVDVTWVLGEVEREQRLDVPTRDSMVSGLRLDELADLLGSTGAYVGNDSGASHLAAAVGVRSFLIFGPTDPCCWAPSAPWVEAIHGDPIHEPRCWGVDPVGLAERVCSAAVG